MTTKLLITGEMRSGTTLVANFLNAQEGITIYRDFLHIGRLAKQTGVSSLVERLTLPQKENLINLFNHDDNALLGLTIDVQTTKFDTLLEFYVYTLDKITQPGDLIVGHKTTREYDVLVELMKLLPELKILLVRRDPRDVVASALELWGNPYDRSLYYHMENWLQSHREFCKLKNNSELGSRVLVLAYEDLILRTSLTLQQLATFLEVEELFIPKTMNDYGHAWVNNSSFNEVNEVLSSRPIGRWQQNYLKAGRISEILLSDAMREAGYENSKKIGKFEKLRVKFRYSVYRSINKMFKLLRDVERNILIPLQKRIVDFER